MILFLKKFKDMEKKRINDPSVEMLITLITTFEEKRAKMIKVASDAKSQPENLLL